MTITRNLFTLLAAAAVVACGNDVNGGDEAATADSAAGAPSDGDAPVVTFTPENETGAAGKPTGPVTVTYRIIGQPVVGQPMAIDLRVDSALGPQPVTVSYRINDASALRLAESQPREVSLSLVADERRGATGNQQVTIVPLREGRLYLNVAASVPTADGSMSTVTAIPIQVGAADRTLEEQGEVQVDADGEKLRVLPADDN